MAKTDDLMRVVHTARAQAEKRYNALVARIMAAHAAGLKDAEEAYQDELDDIERLQAAALRLAFGEGAGSRKAGPALRPPTWKSAVLAALEAGPKRGMHVSDILIAVQAMGVKATGEKTATDPLRMVDEALYRLGDRVERVGRRVWKLSHKSPHGNES